MNGTAVTMEGVSPEDKVITSWGLEFDPATEVGGEQDKLEGLIRYEAGSRPNEAGATEPVLPSRSDSRASSTIPRT